MIPSKTVFKAIIRDLYHRKTRTFTIFISISIIVIFPIGFLNTGPSLVYSLDQASNESHLAHLEIFFAGVPNSTVQEIKNLTNPTDIDGRIRITGIIDNKLVNDQKQEVYIISYPADNISPSVNIPMISQGSWNNDNGSCALLESFANYMNISLGDQIVVKGKDTILSLNVTAFVTSVEFMSYDLLGNGVVYVTYSDAKKLAGFPTNPLISAQFEYNDVVLYFGESSTVTKDFLKEKVALIEDKYNNDTNPLNDPIFIWFTRVSSVRASLAEGTDLVGKYLGATATFATLVTGFVIYIIMNRYINEDRKLIGVYQSFGFNKKEIIFMYAGKTFLISLGSVLVGTIGACIVLSVITSTLANLWGIIKLFLLVDPITLILFWFLAISSSVIFAVIPAFQVVNLIPHESLREIRKIGITNKGFMSKLTGKLPSIPKMAFRTLARNRVRTMLTVIAIISAMALSIALLSALSSVNYTVDSYFENNMKFDGRIEYYDPQNVTELNYIQNQTGVLEAEPNYIYITNPLEDISEVVSIRGMVNNSKTYVPDFLEKSSDFSFTKNGNYTNQALVSERVMRKLNLSVGDDLSIKWLPGGTQYPNLTFKIGGMIRDFEYSIGVYVNIDFLRSHLMDKNNFFTSITLKLSNSIDKKAFINNQLERSKISYVMNIGTIRDNVDRIINSQIFIVSISVLLGFIVAFISVFNTQYITLIERDRDISIMLAFGYNRKYFFFEFLMEILLLVPLSVVLAIAVSRPIAQFFLDLIEENVVRMDYYLGQNEIILSLTFVMITTLIATVIPTLYFVSTKRLNKILRSDE